MQRVCLRFRSEHRSYSASVHFSSKKSRRKKLTLDLSRVTYYMITCCLKSLPSVVESPTETLVVQIEFRKEDKKDNIMATSVHPDKFRGESLELEREPQELSEEDKLKVRSKL